MDAFALMKKDHRNVKKLFKKVAKAKKPEEREKLFKEIKRELDAHAHMEENAFYPAMRQQKSTHDITLESYEEHHIVKILLEELSTIAPYREEWDAKMTVLIENVEHHIGEEEKDFFPKAKKILGSKAKELGKEMATIKKNYLEDL